jgi:hypothetical protein
MPASGDDESIKDFALDGMETPFFRGSHLIAGPSRDWIMWRFGGK